MTRLLAGDGIRDTQPRRSSLVTTCDSRDSEALVLPARALMVRVRSSVSESIARHR